MKNDLKTPQEQTSVTETDMNPISELWGRIDWRVIFIMAVMATVTAFIVFAGFKLWAIWDKYPFAVFLSFLDVHTPLMLFSGVFTLIYIQHRETEVIAMVSLFSTILNALLV